MAAGPPLRGLSFARAICLAYYVHRKTQRQGYFMKVTEHSGQTAEFEVDGCKYQISLLSVQAAFKAQVILGNQFKGLYGQGVGQVDPDVMWSLTEKMLKHAEVDGFPLDMEAHFSAKIDTLDLVFFEALKANCPNFFQKLSGLKGLFVDALASQFGSAKSTSESATSRRATAKK